MTRTELMTRRDSLVAQLEELRELKLPRTAVDQDRMTELAHTYRTAENFVKAAIRLTSKL